MTQTLDIIERIMQSPIVGLDTETYDPYLLDLGPSLYRGEGCLLGVSISDGHESLYLPLRHIDTDDTTRANNTELIHKITRSNNAKVGANILYDYSWLDYEGYSINGILHDVQYAEPLLDEYAPTSLEKLAIKYSCASKATGILEKYCAENGFDIRKRDPRAYLYKMPQDIVRNYAELDAHIALQVYKKQAPLLQAQNLTELYHIEIGLIPFLAQMRKQGVRIDVPLLNNISLAVADEITLYQEKIYQWADQEFDIGSPLQLARLFDKKGILYPRKAPTPLMAQQGKLGNPNLDKDSLEVIAEKHSIAKDILAYRHYCVLANTFLRPYYKFITQNHRIHCSFHPLRSDTYGTVSGRFSSSLPNLQQVSKLEEDGYSLTDNPILKGKILRKLFLPEEGCTWAKLDYAQVEYRIGAHYALGEGAQELRQTYIDNPSIDYHKYIQDLTNLDRTSAKRLNFGIAYGMGIDTLMKKFHWTREQAELFSETYNSRAPYLLTTRRAVINKAKRVGYIRTILNRRARVNASRNLHSFYNRLIQGTAADIMKKALVIAYQDGVFNVLYPHLLVHDEIDVSVLPTTEAQEALAYLKNVLETSVKLSVPLLVDVGTGTCWAAAE